MTTKTVQVAVDSWYNWIMMKAPFKRGSMLRLTCRKHNTHVDVKYVKWWGVMRSALIVVRFSDGKETTVHVNDVKLIP